MLFGACHLAPADPGPLPALGADLTRTTVSGISLGGLMAVQLATAYSARFVGIGVIAAGSDYCTDGYPALSLFANATNACVSPSIAMQRPDAGIAWINANLFAEEELIDTVDNVGKQALYASDGGDRTVKNTVVDTLLRYYLAAGAAAKRIKYDTSNAAGIVSISNNAVDLPCALTKAPFINNCGAVQADALLHHLYGDGRRPSNGGVAAGRIIAFAQRDFVDSPLASMGSVAYAYVPNACQTEACAVHVVLHDCLQGASATGAHFYAGAGYNAFADTHQLIILYPQAVASRGVPVNPLGCWDFWGYSVKQNAPPYNAALPPFFAKGAPQMAAIVRMIERLGAPRGTLATIPSPAPHP